MSQATQLFRRYLQLKKKKSLVNLSGSRAKTKVCFSAMEENGIILTTKPAVPLIDPLQSPILIVHVNTNLCHPINLEDIYMKFSKMIW